MSRRHFFLAAGVVVLLLAGVVNTFASSSPDGLEQVAQDQEIAHTAQNHPLRDAPMAGYGVDALADPVLATGLAGVTGVVVVLALTMGLAFVVRRRRPDGPGRSTAAPAAPGQDAGSRGG